MDRISGANFLTVALKRMFQDRNAQAGVFAGTFFNALWSNGVQESILAPVEKIGLVASDADNTQLLQAIIALQARGLYVFPTPGFFTWTVPPAWTDAHSLVIGGGAGGASGIAGYAGFGGPSGGISWNLSPFAGGAVVNGIVGAGGTSDNPGGSSSFGLITSTGGRPGAQGSASGPNSSGFGQVGLGQGTLAISGTYGDSPISSGAIQIGGNGGSSLFGGGGKGAQNASGNGEAGAAATAAGAGGGGGSGAQPGGQGAPGLVLVWR